MNEYITNLTHVLESCAVIPEGVGLPAVHGFCGRQNLSVNLLNPLTLATPTAVPNSAVRRVQRHNDLTIDVKNVFYVFYFGHVFIF